MNKKKIVFTSIFAAVVLSLTGCDNSDKDKDDGKGIWHGGIFYPYGAMMPGGRVSGPGIVANSSSSSSTTTPHTSGTTRGGFGGTGAGAAT